MEPDKESSDESVVHNELPTALNDPLIKCLHRIIRFAVRVLAILMTFVIVWGTVDVVYVMYIRLSTPPLFLLQVEDILQTFGAFMAVLIAIEIFINIRLYLGTRQLPIELVVATALMAISRKVIILDFDQVSADYVFGISTVVLALGATYWLVAKKAKESLY